LSSNCNIYYQSQQYLLPITTGQDRFYNRERHEGGGIGGERGGKEPEKVEEMEGGHWSLQQAIQGPGDY